MQVLAVRYALRQEASEALRVVGEAEEEVDNTL